MECLVLLNSLRCSNMFQNQLTHPNLRIWSFEAQTDRQLSSNGHATIRKTHQRFARGRLKPPRRFMYCRYLRCSWSMAKPVAADLWLSTIFLPYKRVCRCGIGDSTRYKEWGSMLILGERLRMWMWKCSLVDVGIATYGCGWKSSESHKLLDFLCLGQLSRGWGFASYTVEKSICTTPIRALSALVLPGRVGNMTLDTRQCQCYYRCNDMVSNLTKIAKHSHDTMAWS